MATKTNLFNLPNEIINLILKEFNLINNLNLSISKRLENNLILATILPINLGQSFLFNSIDLITEDRTKRLINSLSLPLGASDMEIERNKNLKLKIKILNFKTKDRNENNENVISDGNGVTGATLLRLLTLIPHIEILKIDSHDGFGKFFDFEIIDVIRKSLKGIKQLEIGLESGPKIYGLENCMTLIKNQEIKLEILKLSNLKSGFSVITDTKSNLLLSSLQLFDYSNTSTSFCSTLTSLTLESLYLTEEDYKFLFQEITKSALELKKLNLKSLYKNTGIGEPINPELLTKELIKILPRLESLTLILATKIISRLERINNPISELPSLFRPANSLFLALQSTSTAASTRNLTSLTLGGPLNFTKEIFSLLPVTLKSLHLHSCSNDKARLYPSGVNPSEFLSAITDSSSSSFSELKEILLTNMESDPEFVEDIIWDYDSIEFVKSSLESYFGGEGRCRVFHDIVIVWRPVRVIKSKSRKSSGGGGSGSSNSRKGSKT